MKSALPILLLVWLAAPRPAFGQVVEPPDRWDGSNPFERPAPTTDHHGSGDLDLDGQLTSLDLAQLQGILEGRRPLTIRADVDGTGTVDAEDRRILAGALSGETLPGDWNRLPDRNARLMWVRRMLALDPVSEQPYDVVFRQCGGFSQAAFLNFSVNVADAFPGDFGPGQTTYNLPVYCVIVTSPRFGHAINAVLVGDNPREFGDWFFFEPQDDSGVRPGGWNLPFDTTATIYVPCDIQSGGNNRLQDIVAFEIRQSGPQAVSTNPGLILARPAPASPPAPEVAPFWWEPVILPGGQLLALKSRDDLSRVSDIHATSSLLGDLREAKALVDAPQFSRLLDQCPAANGTVHLLWRGEHQAAPGLYRGTLLPATRELRDVEIVATRRTIVGARIVEPRPGELHVVWLENRANTFHPHESGLYWTTRTPGIPWRTPERIVALPGALDWWVHDAYRDLPRYFFDLAVDGSGDLILAWTQGVNWERQPDNPARSDPPSIRPNISYLRFRNTWEPGGIVEEAEDGVLKILRWTDATGQPRVSYSGSAGLDAATDGAGRVHLVYWFGPKQQPPSRTAGSAGRAVEGRGVLRHRLLADGGWSAPQVVDPAGGAFCPRLVRWADGLGAIWEKGTRTDPGLAWAELRNGAWTPPRRIPVTAGRSAWYPSATALDNGPIALCWSERSGRSADVGLHLLAPSPDAPATPVVRAELSPQADGLALSWISVPGKRYRVESARDPLAASWETLVSSVLARETRSVLSLPADREPGGRGYFRLVEVP